MKQQWILIMNVTNESFKLLLFSNNGSSGDLDIAESTLGDDTPFLGELINIFVLSRYKIKNMYNILC